MHIHTYERLWLAGSMVLIVAFIATVTFGTVGLGITMIGDDEDVLPPDEIDEDERFADPRVEQVGENEYEVYVVAQTFIFLPDPIEVPANNEVSSTSPPVTSFTASRSSARTRTRWRSRERSRR